MGPRVALAEVDDAVALVEFTLRRRLAAEADETYQRLRGRYRDEPEFTRLVDRVAGGLGLRVLGRSTFGLAVAPTEGSVFAARTGDYSKNLGVDLRVLHGLAHLGIAAYCFPTTAALAQSRVLTLEPAKVAAELTDTARRMAEDQPDEVPVDSEELREAWRAWLALPPSNTGVHGELKNKSRLSFVEQALAWLTDQ
jgi:hypothetical protein